MASTDVCEDAEPEEVGSEPSLSVEQTSLEEENCRCPYDGVIVHPHTAAKIAYDLKMILKERLVVRLELYGNVKSAPKYATIEKMAQCTKAVLVIWTPDCEKDKGYIDYVNSLFSFMFQFDITTITYGFKELTPKSCMAIDNTVPVEFDDSDYFFDAMKERLLKQLPKSLCCNTCRDECKQLEEANHNEETRLKQVEAQPDHYADEEEKETAAQTEPTKARGEHIQLKSGVKESGCAAYADDPLSDDVVSDADANDVKHNPPTDGHCEAELRGTTENKGYRRDSYDEGGEYSLRETEGAMTEAGQSERPTRAQESLEAGADNSSTLTKLSPTAEMGHGGSQHERKTDDGVHAERSDRDLPIVDAELLSPSVQPDTSDSGVACYSCKPESWSFKHECSDKEQTQNPPFNLYKDLSYKKAHDRSGKDDSAVNSALQVSLKHTTGKDEVSVSERDRAPATFSYQDESICRKYNSPAALVSESSEDTCHKQATSNSMDELDEYDPHMKKKTRSERAEENTIAGSENECAIEQEASSARRDWGSKGGQGQKQVVNDTKSSISHIVGKDFVQKTIDGAGGRDQNNKYAS